MLTIRFIQPPQQVPAALERAATPTQAAERAAEIPTAAAVTAPRLGDAIGHVAELLEVKDKGTLMRIDQTWKTDMETTGPHKVAFGTDCDDDESRTVEFCLRVTAGVFKIRSVWLDAETTDAELRSLTEATGATLEELSLLGEEREDEENARAAAVQLLGTWCGRRDTVGRESVERKRR